MDLAQPQVENKVANPFAGGMPNNGQNAVDDLLNSDFDLPEDLLSDREENKINLPNANPG
jgi:hypothetical protein